MNSAQPCSRDREGPDIVFNRPCHNLPRSTAVHGPRRHLGPATQASGPGGHTVPRCRRRAGVPHRPTRAIPARRTFDSPACVPYSHAGRFARSGPRIRRKPAPAWSLPPRGGPSFCGRPQRWSATVTIVTTIPSAASREVGDGCDGIAIVSTAGRNDACDHVPAGACIHAGMSRWPCSTRQTSMWSGCPT